MPAGRPGRRWCAQDEPAAAGALAQHVDLLQGLRGGQPLCSARSSACRSARSRNMGSPGRIETAGVVGSPAADHTTVLVPHHESASAVAWSPPVQAGPVAARRPWLAGCARDRQVGEEQLLSGARRHVVTRPPTTSRAHTGGFTRPRVASPDRTLTGSPPAALAAAGSPAARPADRSRSCSRTSRRIVGCANRGWSRSTCWSSNRIVTGRPDHRCDIFPALITKRPASASIACKLRRLPDITLPRRPSADSTSSSSASEPVNGPTTGDGPGLFDVGLVDMHGNHRGVQPTGDPKPPEWQQHSSRCGKGRRQRNAATGAGDNRAAVRRAGDAPPPRPGRPATHRWSRTLLLESA